MSVTCAVHCQEVKRGYQSRRDFADEGYGHRAAQGDMPLNNLHFVKRAAWRATCLAVILPFLFKLPIQVWSIDDLHGTLLVPNREGFAACTKAGVLKMSAHLPTVQKPSTCDLEEINGEPVPRHQ